MRIYEPLHHLVADIVERLKQRALPTARVSYSREGDCIEIGLELENGVTLNFFAELYGMTRLEENRERLAKEHADRLYKMFHKNYGTIAFDTQKTDQSQIANG